MRTQTEAGRELQLARENTDALFRLVKPAFLYERPIAERHRMVFYLGHLEAFDWNLIARYALDVPAFALQHGTRLGFGVTVVVLVGTYALAILNLRRDAAGNSFHLSGPA